MHENANRTPCQRALLGSTMSHNLLMRLSQQAASFSVFNTFQRGKNDDSMFCFIFYFFLFGCWILPKSEGKVWRFGKYAHLLLLPNSDEKIDTAVIFVKNVASASAWLAAGPALLKTADSATSTSRKMLLVWQFRSVSAHTSEDTLVILFL